MKKYNPKEIEKRWQSFWLKKGINKTDNKSDKPKYYILDMFPYPSGAGLHVGHPKGYIATDVVARMKMMQGSNVLHPMGWDAFGLPAENYAIANKVHPKVATDKNIATFKKQLGKIGFTHDWSREINTTDPKYYKWTQWTFLQMFKRGLAYESNEPVNWCPVDKTVLANEDLENGCCERCGSPVERRPMRQWVLRITKYADRMLNDLDKLPKWPTAIKEMQRNWIGKSEGTSIKFPLSDSPLGRGRGGLANQVIEVFTTRPDTLFGVTYVVISPENKLVGELKIKIKNWSEVEQYLEQAKTKSDLERTELQKEKTGVKLEGIFVKHPVTGEEIQVWIADYVLANYGTGAVMAVPAHDERDFEFAKKYNLPVKEVVAGGDVNSAAYTEIGKNINSDFLNGLSTSDAKEKMITWLEEHNSGKKQINYKLRDWVFSRQRYWGEPIPIVHCEKCGAVPVPEKDLPVELPKVKNYEPTGTGESPLANIEKWVNTKCPKCDGPAKRETNTMPQWAGSSWYYLRYIDPSNDKALVDKKLEKYWSPVDFYVGGAEHATRHLIYARFWHKFLFDIGAVNYEEPFTRLQNVGLIMAEDGRKMSKRWGNVINPDDVIDQYGADSLRIYEMFMGPFAQAVAWSTQGLIGARRFLDRVWHLQDKLDMGMSPKSQSPISKSQTNPKDQNSKLITVLHQTIKKVSDDIEEMRFNTAIAKMMELANEMSKQEKISKENFALFVQILAPFAPHFAEELWLALGHKKSIFTEVWPKYDSELAKSETFTLAVQINGKVRDTIEVESEISEAAVKELIMKSEKVQKWLEGKEPKKIIYIKGKLVSVVV
ncbi:MAG: leucine--tRNA ligase [Patescibacteria group bacterium]